jgi:hypothetical protein
MRLQNGTNDSNGITEDYEGREDYKAKESINKALELLKTIKILDDLKERKDEILAIIEEFIRSGVESLREIIKRSMSPKEIKREFNKFQHTQELFYKKLDEEMGRVSNLDGAKEYIDSLKDEMEERLKPHAEELAKLMGEIMSLILGSIMEGSGSAIQADVNGESKDIVRDKKEKEN